MRHKATCGNNHRSYVTKQTVDRNIEDTKETTPIHPICTPFGLAEKRRPFTFFFFFFFGSDFLKRALCTNDYTSFFVICWKLSLKNWRASFLPVIGRVKISS